MSTVLNYYLLLRNGFTVSNKWSGTLSPYHVSPKIHLPEISPKLFSVEYLAGLGGSVGCAVRLETRRSRVQPPPRSATFFRGD